MDLDAVNLGLDENELDINAALQQMDESFDTRSEATDSGDSASSAHPSISSVSTEASSEQRRRLTKKRGPNSVNHKTGNSKESAPTINKKKKTVANTKPAKGAAGKDNNTGDAANKAEKSRNIVKAADDISSDLDEDEVDGGEAHQDSNKFLSSSVSSTIKSHRNTGDDEDDDEQDHNSSPDHKRKRSTQQDTVNDNGDDKNSSSSSDSGKASFVRSHLIDII